MAAKTDTEVLIGGKVFTLCGYESEEYLQKVASYINSKLNEYNKLDSFRRQTMDYQNILLELNMADDYFKAKKQINLLEDEIHSKEEELSNVKHELIATKIKMDNMDKNLQAAKSENAENAKTIIRLETELKERERKDNKTK